MKSDQIKALINEPKGAKSFLTSDELKKVKNEALRKIKKANGRIDQKSKEGVWLTENYDFLWSHLSGIRTSDLRINRDAFVSLKKILAQEDFEASKDEFSNMISQFCEAYQWGEKELQSFQSIAYLALFAQIGNAAMEEKNELPRLILYFHKMNQIDFNQLSFGFSPIEKLLRLDPDGSYPKMTRQTQLLYKSKIEKEAKKNKLSAQKYCEKILQEAGHKKRHIGFYLKEKKNSVFYFYLLFLLTAVLFVPFYFSVKKILLSVFAVLPIYFFAKALVDFAYSRITKNEPLPAMRMDRVSDPEKTAVVITSLISSEKDVDLLLEKIKTIQVNNSDASDEIYYGLICDLLQSGKKTRENDEILISHLKEGIDLLNKSESLFFASVRRRVYHQSEDAYVGWERKRGAIEQTVDFLKEGKLPKKFEFFGERAVVGSKFLITLDADTELGIGQAKRLIGIHTHPLNRPILEKKGDRFVVSSGFGILQPKITSSLLHPIQSPFAKIFSNGGGEILYASASFDLMQSLFGIGNFCGKGIIDVDAYHKVMKNALPEQKILSHDMPEGALLRAGLVNNEFFVDSDPQTVTSFYKRLHRWIRGDIQNLQVLDRLNRLRRWFAIENCLRYLLPISEFLLLLLSNFIGKREAVVCGLLIVLFHFQSFFISTVSNLLCGQFHLFPRRFATGIRNLILNSFYVSILSLGSIAFEAAYFADAIIRSAYRMLISKKKLLEWQVYSPFSSSKSELLLFLPSILLSTAFLFVIQSFVPLFLALLWLFYPVLMLYLSIPYKRQEKISEKQKAELKKLAEKEFLFFKHCVSEKTAFLPPDNIQFQPIEKTAMRTSPTNIGLYLSSLISARDFNFISEKEALDLLEKALVTIEKLDRYKGHLYNWYDLNTLGVIGEGFVSTVDSGNYFAALITVRSALLEFDASDTKVKSLIEKIDFQISQVDFSVLFDYEKNLFFVGIFPDHPKNETSYYDLYMSEARITSFLAIALGQIPASHWKTLNRSLLSFYGRVGAASWTGTAFEYFMAPLFLPIIKNSFEDESLEFAYFCQRKYAANASQSIQVFGISESGYSLVDDKGNLQYKAFGVPFLSVRSKEIYPKVISPYSSFLMVEKSPEIILENLENLAKIGMSGPFGFYEAVEFGSDFLDDYSIVFSYMSHHKGMSLISLANACFDRIFEKRFLNFSNFKAKESLLAERFPIEAKVTKKKKEFEKKEQSITREETEIVPFSEIRKKAKVITDGKATFLSFDDGTNRFLFEERDAFDPIKGGLSCRVITREGSYSFSREFQDRIKTCFGADFAEYTLIDKKISITLHFELISGYGAILVRLETSGIAGGASIEFDFDLILENENKFNAHPAFSLLSLEGKSNGERLVIRRRGKAIHNYFCIQSSIPFRTSFSEFNFEKAFSYKMLYDSKIKIEFEKLDAENLKLPLILSFSKNEEAQNLLPLLDGSYLLKDVYRSKGIDRMNRLHQISFYRPSCRKIENQILCQLFKNRRFLISEDAFLQSVPQDFLWRYGISGDVPVVCISVKCGAKKEMEQIRDSIRVFKKLKIAGFNFDLVILHEGKSGYFDPIRDEFTDMITENKCEFLIGKNGGIHFVAYDEKRIHDTFLTLSALVLFEEEKNALPEVFFFPKEKEWNQSERKDLCVGRFLEKGFEINKNQINPAIPFSHIISGRTIGFASDQNSLGFTWFRNAGLNRISKWENLPNRTTGEKLYLEFEGDFYDLIGYSDKIEYLDHIAVYSGKIFGEEFRIFVTISSYLSAKTIYVFLSKKLKTNSRLHFSFVPSLGKGADRNILITRESECFVSIAAAMHTEYHTGAYFLCKESEVEYSKANDRIVFTMASQEEMMLLLGGFSSKRHLEFIKQECRNMDEETLLLKEKQFTFEVSNSKNTEGERFWPFYQAVYARFFGRTGVSQSSGAFGFRDQLQDCLIFLPENPHIVKQHILRAASHQFLEGDVMHWWHPNKTPTGTNAGIRSRCSDDYLWLLFAASEYLNETGDFEILKLKAPFLSAKLLKDNETEEYLSAEISNPEPLLKHLMRAAELFIRRGLGPHNLPFIGCGDWNDGMNSVTGESVWLGFFGAICLNRCKRYFDPDFARIVDQFLLTLSKGLNASFNGAWFARAYRENGDILGNDRSVESECSIDLITQAFAAFYYLEMKETTFSLDERAARLALVNAYFLLKDEKASLIRLFRRPFVNTFPTPGYIQRYCAGVRENGGQYTHAAVWFALALLRFGIDQNDPELIGYAFSCKKLIDPRKNVESKNFSSYLREPYVLCGDVYDAPGFRGRGGWSWYTGAAGWYYRLLSEIETYEKGKNG